MENPVSLFENAMNCARSGAIRTNGKHNASFRILVAPQAAHVFAGQEGISVGESSRPGEGLIVSGLGDRLTHGQYNALRAALNQKHKERGFERA